MSQAVARHGAAKIAVAGTGYVGLSNAVLLAQHNEVVAIDIVSEKVDMLNNKQSPIEDAELEHYLATKPLNLRAALGKVDADAGADFVNTFAVEVVIQVAMAIKSTVPVGFTAKLHSNPERCFEWSLS